MYRASLEIDSSELALQELRYLEGLRGGDAPTAGTLQR